MVRLKIVFLIGIGVRINNKICNWLMPEISTRFYESVIRSQVIVFKLCSNTTLIFFSLSSLYNNLFRCWYIVNTLVMCIRFLQYLQFASHISYLLFQFLYSIFSIIAIVLKLSSSNSYSSLKSQFYRGLLYQNRLSMLDYW